MSSAPYQDLDPAQFVQPGARLLIDTNVFMEMRPAYAGGLKPLFRKCAEEITRNVNPIVVPTKVQDELKKNAVNLKANQPEKAAKAANAIEFLLSASEQGLVRTDLGDHSNPYADDLFLAIFEQFANQYTMCLLTFDVTIKLRVRLLAHQTGRRLVAGHPTRNGHVRVESDRELFRKGIEKLDARRGGDMEMKVLVPLLEGFAKAYAFTTDPVRRDDTPETAKPFSATAKLRPADVVVPVVHVPAAGDLVHVENNGGMARLRLGAQLGEGGEGNAYLIDGLPNAVAKIFDLGHVTRHREEKVSLLIQRSPVYAGICFPSAIVKNPDGQFVGYVMPRAGGKEFQRTLFNPRRFKEEFPHWTKADLVDVCIAFLEKVIYLHSLNIVLGDINPKNLMVDDKKNVSIIDADSWQLEGYPCPVGHPMFTAPALQDVSYAVRLRTMDDENFATATMLFMILITGQFPYMRKDTDGDMVKLIQEGIFAFQYENRNDRNQPDGDWKYMWSHVHKPVKDMFWHTFHKEGRRYARRPSASEWLTLFKGYRTYLAGNTSFDPMSNEVFPIRNKAYRLDTPIQDCPQCGRGAAIAGIWKEDEENYFVPRRCTKCRDSQPGAPRKAAVAPRVVTTGCMDCFKDFPKKDLKHGRCPPCALKAEALDDSRRCVDCRQPFITFDHIGWLTDRALDVPKSHQAIKQICAATTAPTKTSAPRTKRTTTKQSFWSRLFG